MEEIATKQTTADSSCAMGAKTLNRLGELPVVNTAVTNAVDYYGKVKESNALMRTSCNLAEMSLKTMAFAAMPFTALCKRPINTVDSYLYEKVGSLENSYPVISKPTEQLTAQAKDIYDKTVTSMVKASKDTLDAQFTKTTTAGVRVVDGLLENRLVHLFTDPVLNFTEKSLDYWIPVNGVPVEMNGENSLVNNMKIIDELAQGEPKTLKRIYDINNRVCKHIYSTTFVQLNRIHAQFEQTIKSLQSLKQFADMMVTEKRQKLTEVFSNVSKSSLVAQCADFIDKNNLSLSKMEIHARNYSKVILADVNQLVDKYMSLVKNFPIVFNGTAMKQLIDNLKNQLNKESISVYLNPTIDQLKKIHQALLSYTNQMFGVVNNMTAQLLNAKPIELNNTKPSTATTGRDINVSQAISQQ